MNERANAAHKFAFCGLHEAFSFGSFLLVLQHENN
jgi:hypothetical protein